MRGADGWRHAAERVALSVDALGTVPAGEALRWASVARETSGVFGAWAGRIEKVAPGALCRAADTLAWSAQTRRGGPRPAERDSAVVDFRGVAGVAAQAAISADSAAGWLLLIRQMTRTVEVVRRAHEERGEALQAARLAALVGGELAELHRDFERSAAAAMAPGPGYDRADRDKPGEYGTGRDRPDPRRGGEPGRDDGFER
ncbi:MAG TPA: hypothetical protein VN786_03665 [Acidimicrobiales bacterium]|nr:hypothetical protein [Acidimicrobiales bacterium]